MEWEIWYGTSLGILILTWVAAFILSKVKYKRKRLITPNKILFFGTFLAAVVYFCPIYTQNFTGEEYEADGVKVFLIAVQNAFRLFALDGDYVSIVEDFAYPDNVIRIKYTALGALLYAFAPLLSFGFILSFFKNFAAHRRYFFNFWKTTHVFSELNEKSLALAENIMKNNRKTRRFSLFPTALVVFTDVLEKNEEENIELIDGAKELGAILFRKDLESVRYRFKKSSRKVNFYLISDDEEEKIRHAESVMKNYDYKGVVLRVFSNDVRSELLLASKNVNKMKVIRVNDIQSLIYHNLDRYGEKLFQTAMPGKGGKSVISAVIVGLGKYGREQLKALSWFCQLEGYSLKVNAFDINEKAEEKFASMCPDLMSEEYNGKIIRGDAEYDIKIHPGVDVSMPEFKERLKEIEDVTYIFVCLGNDAINLKNAAEIRMLCKRNFKHSPYIEAVVYDSNICSSMGYNLEKECGGVTNFKNQPYNIHMIGDLENFYSVETVIDSELIDKGCDVHMRYADDDKDFWKYEYNYRSSIAKAIHERLRRKLGLKIPGINKSWDERTEEEKLAIGTVEHRRWNAYMRSEGYRYSGSKDKSTRDDLAKLHHNLVPVTELSDDDLRKDA